MTTRLATPERRVAAGGLVPRPRLFDLLSATPPGAVALVCAPAGSGKTVLLRSWAHAERLGEQFAWVSLERGEHDAQHFWLTVIDALAATAPGAECIQRTAPSPDFRGRVVLDGLVADLLSLEARVVLAIDDLHELQSTDALQLLELFLADLPPYVTVVLSTREDPRLGLHRLRLTGQLTEIRGDDLRFSRDEAGALLREAGIDLSDADVDVLHERTEGWAAGLRMASISLAAHRDPARFVREFCGSERTVAAYLMAEVLERHPAEVREMLLRTSILERVSGPLADFLTGGSGAERALQELEDANAFVTSLDAGRSWFRYHHLFADLLQLELRRVAPATIAPLHRAAAQWFEEQGYVVEAIHHAQAARDWPFAVRLLVDAFLDLTLDGRLGTVAELLGAFPDDVASSDPELALVFAMVRLLRGGLDDCAAHLDLAERNRGQVAHERAATFELVLALIRLMCARWRGELATVLELKRVCEASLAAQPATDRVRAQYRCIAQGNAGIAELWSSRVDDARRDLEEALTLARSARRPWVEIAARGHLGIAVVLTGEPVAAGLKWSEEAVRIADTHGWPEDPIVVTPLATGAMTLLWLGRLEEAERWLERAQRTLYPGGEPASELIVHDARGLLRLAQGRLDEALAAFRDSERMHGLLANKHPFGIAGRARILQTLARMGRLSEARAALAEVSEDDRDVATFRVAAATIELAAGDADRAIDVLAPVLEGTAPAINGPSAAVETQVLDALARDRLGDARAAEASIERALGIAEPEGLMLPFALAPVGALLERRQRHRTAHPVFLAAILDMLAGKARPSELADRPSLRDDLSEAELRILRYLPGNMKAPEIAAELFVSNNTVRTHLRHIYAKLDAHTRTEAVARARELRLIGPASGAL